MHEHLGLHLAGSSSAPPTPPATQSSNHSGLGPSSLSSSARPQSTTSGPSAPRPPIQGGAGISIAPAQQHPAQNPQQPAQQQQAQQQVAQQQAVQAPVRAPPQVPGQPAANLADKIAALRARITELEWGDAHGNHIPARAAPPHQALIADAAAIDRVRANLATAKDEPKKLALPVLHPGHKVSALSLPIPPKVEEAFKLY
ncbi:hypothetical protein EDB19DRAFT_1690932, partial [Suillus lakei]